MDHRFTISCDVAGGLILVDKALLETFGEPEAIGLTFVLDPEGKSELARDYPAADWSAVRAQYGAPFLRHCAAGQAMIDLLAGGEFSVRISSESSEGEGEPLETHRGRLVVGAGLVAIEATSLVEGLLGAGPVEPVATMAMPGGAYEVQVCHLGHPPKAPGAVSGVYWGRGGPAISLSLTPAPGAPDPEGNVLHLERKRLDESVRGVALHRAVVRRVEDGKALLDILVSPNVRCGFAEATLPATGLSPGDAVVIEMVGREGGRS